MSQPPGSDELASIREDIQSKVAAELRKDLEAGLTKIREEMSQDKIHRAEQHSGYMRNWLFILTAIVSALLGGFGFLGVTHTSDIEAYRKQMAADAADVKTLSAGVRESAKTVAASVNSISTYQQRVADLDSKMKDTDARITDTDRNIAAIEKRSEQAERQIVAALNNTSALAQQTHNDFQSSIASGFLGDIPSVSSATLVQGPALSSIEGTGFGQSAGHIFVDIQYTNLFTSNLQLPARIEIQPPFRKWTETKIEFELSPSEYQKIKDARASQTSASSVSTLSGNVINLSGGLGSSVYLSLIVETSQGRFSISGSSLSVSWP